MEYMTMPIFLDGIHDNVTLYRAGIERFEVWWLQHEAKEPPARTILNLIGRDTESWTKQMASQAPVPNCLSTNQIPEPLVPSRRPQPDLFN